MSQDSCDDEDKHAALPPPTVETPGSQRTTNIRQDQREPSEPSCWRRPTTWNVVFNGILAITTALLGLIAYWQLNSSHLDQRA